MCSVTGVESLNATTNFEWKKYHNYYYRELVSSNAVLTFSPLLSSHEGRYTCIAAVSSPYFENDYYTEEYFTVEGKFTRKHG